MAKKNLIISAFTNYNFKQLKPYVKSIEQVAPDADKVMVVGLTDPDTRIKLTDCGWHIENLPQVKEIPVHVLRFLPMFAYLDEHRDQYDLVVSTDVKDVVFQSDPFTWLSDNLAGKKLVAGSESLKYQHEPWGDDNLKSTFGGYVYDLFKDHVIYNVGTLGGQADYMRDLFFNLFYNSINKPIPIVDQAVFNVMIQTQPYKDVTLFAEQKMAWACQAGTVADPTKMSYFRPNLLETEPVFQDGVVMTSDLKPFTIVHQYDRVPAWREFFLKKYE